MLGNVLLQWNGGHEQGELYEEVRVENFVLNVVTTCLVNGPCVLYMECCPINVPNINYIDHMPTLKQKQFTMAQSCDTSSIYR